MKAKSYNHAQEYDKRNIKKIDLEKNVNENINSFKDLNRLLVKQEQLELTLKNYTFVAWVLRNDLHDESKF